MVLPLVSGFDSTVTVQLAFDASVLGLIGQLFVCANWPQILIPLIVIAVDSSLVKVAVWEALVVPAGTLANNQSVALTISSIQLAAPFSQTNNCPGAGGPSGTLAAGASCTISITYSPTTVAYTTAYLTVCGVLGLPTIWIV